MENKSRFVFTTLVVGFAHLCLVLALMLASRSCARNVYSGGGEGAGSPEQEVVWVDPAIFSPEPDNAEPEIEVPPPTKEDVDPLVEPLTPERPFDEVVSELLIPIPSPIPSPTPTPTRKPISTPKPTAVATPKPKATSKPTPKPSSKPKAKTASPVAKKKPAESTTVASKKEAFQKAKESDNKTSGPTKKGSGGASGGGTGQGAGGTGPDFAGYHSMIRERFFQQWIQPQSVFTLDKKSVATVTIKIEKTGRISGVSLLKSSGNPVMDESVMDAARKVTQIEPLPAGIKQTVYEVDIDFELQ